MTEDTLTADSLPAETKPPERMSPLAAEIHRRMKAKGMNSLQLAMATGRSANYFRDFFRGRMQAPSSTILPDIAVALDCDVNDLLNPGRARNVPGFNREAHQAHEADEIALLGFWRGLTRMGKRRVMYAIIREASQVAAARQNVAESCS